MENAGSTEPGDVISELEGMEFADDPRGSITIDPDSHQAQAPTIIGTTSTDDEVPYEGVGLAPSQSISVDRGTVVDLLEQAETDLPPGI
jgi:branched-chain amino acid transport system substrate-binding protein